MERVNLFMDLRFGDFFFAQLHVGDHFTQPLASIRMVLPEHRHGMAEFSEHFTNILYSCRNYDSSGALLSIKASQRFGMLLHRFSTFSGKVQYFCFNIT